MYQTKFDKTKFEQFENLKHTFIEVHMKGGEGMPLMEFILKYL